MLDKPLTGKWHVRVDAFNHEWRLRRRHNCRLRQRLSSIRGTLNHEGRVIGTPVSRPSPDPACGAASKRDDHHDRLFSLW